MISKAQIDSWLEINATGDNNKDHEPDYFCGSGVSLKRMLLEAKVLVDRWCNVSTDIIFHTSKKDFVKEKLGPEIYKAASNLTDVVAKIKNSTAWNSSLMNVSHEELEKILCEKFDKQDAIWGATIHYSDDCPVDKGIIVALNPDGQLQTAGDGNVSRSVAVFPM